MRKMLRAAVVSAALAGAALTGVPAASAQVVEDNDGVLNGNNIAVQVPVNVCGNQVNVIAIPVLNAQSAVCKATAVAPQDNILAILGGKKHHDGY